ncbi:MAG: hypothetical protein KME57_14290 [Scytonema hyalinum WJT4-NPBG1]|nr:hypothetical protein [Scytonema hyalinum WJT4-NPBG1]
MKYPPPNRSTSNWWGLPVSFVVATLGTSRKKFVTEDDDGLTRRPEVWDSPLTPVHIAMYPGSNPPPAGR